MKNYILLLILFIFSIFSCNESDEPQEPSIYNLSALPLIENSGTVTPSSGSYTDGSSVIITGIPSIHYYFKEWKGDVTGTTNPITITMNSNKSINAVFELKDTDEDGVTNDIDKCPDTPIGDDVDENGCYSLPYISVNETISLNDLQFTDLKVVGGWAYSQGGISGIIIYHSGINTYVAFERSAPHLIPENCSKMNVENSIKMICPCDNSEFSILNGAPLTNGIIHVARQYKVTNLNSNQLQITNF